MTEQQLIEVLVRAGAVRFGDFQTKSGRASPYFVDVGKVSTGGGLRLLAHALADQIRRVYPGTTHVFGPAYKAIPLAAAVAMELGDAVSFTYNRKEKKDHGEGGVLVGAAYTGGEKVVVVEDVLTAGTSIRESVELLGRHKVQILGAVLVVDRAERLPERGMSAREALARDTGVSVTSLIDVRAILDFALDPKHFPALNEADRTRIAAYRRQYGDAA